eukprot:g18665.t1
MDPPPLPPRWDLRLPAGGTHLPATGDYHVTDVRASYPHSNLQQYPEVEEGIPRAPHPGHVDVRASYPHSNPQQYPEVEDGIPQAPQPGHARTWCCGWKKRPFTSEELEEGETGQVAPASPTTTEEDKIAGGVTMGTLLPDSVYVWACGEKSEQEEDLKTSDELIGCLILLFQAISYIAVIMRSGDPPDNTAYSVVSVAAALYLLVQTASPDLRAGFSLLVDGASLRYRSFGAAMLVVFALLVTAAMKVIFSSAENDASVVAEAVTVLFIADLDEKAKSFFVTIPQKWRLFWLMNIISISFVLALIGIVYVGDPSAVNEDASSDDDSILDYYPAWFVFAVNPAAMTFFSLSASRLLQAVCDTRVSGERAGGLWLWKVLTKGISAAGRAVRREPCFYAVLGVWLIVSLVAWTMWWNLEDTPYAVAVPSFGDNDDHGPEITTNIIELVAANLALAAGLVVMAVCSARDRARSPISTQGPRRSSRSLNFVEDQGSSTRSKHPSRVPVLLVGWGLGYWLISLLFLLGSSWPNGGWAGAPLLVDIVGYILLPLIFLLGVFVVADSNVYGTHVERVLKPVADGLANDKHVLHWMMVTVLRDVTILWVAFTTIGVPFLNII